jgi:glycosyltransferase involved in cell wall biosynthesis
MTLFTTQKKFKVSLVVSDLSASGSGRWGGAIRPFLVAQALQKLDYQVELVGIAYKDDAPPIVDEGLQVFSFPCQRYSGFVGAATKALAKIDGDIIYAVKLKPSSFGLGLVKKFFNRRPLIVDIDDWELSWYGGDNWRYQGNLKQIVRDLWQRNGALKYPDHPLYLQWMEKCVSYADALVIHNQFLQKRFGGIYVPNGKDTSLFNPEKYHPEQSRIKYGLENYRILMFPGAPRPYKGVEDVLMALELLNIPDLRLAIVGGSPYDDYDRELMDKWGKWIIKLPRYPVDVMPEIIAAAHIIVVPQRDNDATKAQFPLKLTDGMAMGKPILATSVGDIPQILGDTGFLVEPDCPLHLAQTIQSIFNDLETANSKGMQARSRCIEKYSIDTMAATLDRIIQSLR